ncbi:MAG: ABC transporter permease [Chloroflexi bacterium]|nr:ABC transporter permease [Chloroflexota bacterium]
MAQYVARRLLVAVPALLGATLLAFLILRVIPGDVAEMILRGEQGEGAALPYSLEQLREELGLNRPLVVQYTSWLWDMARGDMGKSLLTGRSVGAELLHRFPITAQLALMAAILGVGLGVPLGIFTAVRQDSWGDYVGRLGAIFLLGLPGFWLGLLVLLVGVRYFDWIPPVGYYALWDDPKSNLLQLIFPALILGSHQMALIARMTRSSMLEVLREDFIRTARAKGLREQLVVVRHALRNALIPVSTLVFLNLGALFVGTVVMEEVFTIPGMGSLLLNSLRSRDYTMVQAIIFLAAMAFILINLASDLVYGWIDPRISYRERLGSP